MILLGLLRVFLVVPNTILLSVGPPFHSCWIQLEQVAPQPWLSSGHGDGEDDSWKRGKEWEKERESGKKARSDTK